MYFVRTCHEWLLLWSTQYMLQIYCMTFSSDTDFPLILILYYMAFPTLLHYYVCTQQGLVHIFEFSILEILIT